MASATYLIALGSNRRGRHGGPACEVEAALREIGGVIARSPFLPSAPIGPSVRRFVNAAAIIATSEAPRELLARLKAIERGFGRRRGQRWGARVIDLDIILWSDGRWADGALTIPHPHFRERGFVLGPGVRIAPAWRDPVTRLTLRQLAARLTRRAPLPTATADGSGP